MYLHEIYTILEIKHNVAALTRWYIEHVEKFERIENAEIEVAEDPCSSCPALATLKRIGSLIEGSLEAVTS